MEEFIRVLTEQIRCVKARDGVAKEIADHITDQAEHYEAEGMEHEEAVREAVRQMGDPVAIGAELDHIHRPRMDWHMLLLAAVCNLGGLLAQYLSGSLSASPGMAVRQCLFVAVGLAVMVGIYFLDYGFIGKYAKEIYIVMAVTVAVYTLTGPEVNGMHRGVIMIMFLFVPVYGGILYQYRGEGWRGIICGILFLFLPVWVCWFLIPSLPTAVNLFVIFGCMLLAAVGKGWFAVDRRKALAALVGIGVVLPALFGVAGYHFLMADYQKMRIRAFLNPREYMWQAGYIYCHIRDMLAQSRWFGGAELEGVMPFEADESYLLAQLIASYGLILGLAVVIALVAVCIRAFRICVRQKNQLGLMLGLGCGLVFLVLGIEGVGVNLGLLPSTTVLLPFLTSGGKVTICYDILIGLLLSIYRYQNICGEKKYTPGWRISLRVEKKLRS